MNIVGEDESIEAGFIEMDPVQDGYSTRSTIRPLTSIPTWWSYPGGTSGLTNGGRCTSAYHGSRHQGGIQLSDKENYQ
jgi:hypothetical protein